MEEANTDLLYAIAWYAMGIFSYRITSKILNYGFMASVYQDAILNVLSILKKTNESIDSINKLKYKSLEKYTESDLIDIEIDKDERAMGFWRMMCIVNIQKLTPGYFSGILKFKNWKEAMEYLKLKEGGDAPG